MTGKQAKSFYTRAFLKADSVWYSNVRTLGKDKANQVHQDSVQTAWNKYGKIITEAGLI